VVDRRTALAGGALVLAGCGSGTLRSRVKNGARVTSADIEVLNRLLEVEYYGVAAYTAGIPFLPHAQRKAAKQFLGQDVTHASTLAGLIKQGGGKAIRPRASYDLGRPRASDILALLHRLEGDQLDAYIQLIPSLSDGRLRSTAAAIMGNDAQHLSVLRATLGLQAVPSALASAGE
jgi:hypothetical protein